MRDGGEGERIERGWGINRDNEIRESPRAATKVDWNSQLSLGMGVEVQGLEVWRCRVWGCRDSQGRNGLRGRGLLTNLKLPYT